MKQFILFLLLSAVSLLEAETVQVNVIENAIEIRNFNIEANCCSSYQANYRLDGNLITIVQRDTSSEKCRCLCQIDITHRINQIPKGNYVIEIYREELQRYGYKSNKNDFVFRSDVVVETEFSKSPLSFSMEQTACKAKTETENIENMNLKFIEVFPNPANSNVTIRFGLEKQGNVKLTLLNVIGKTVFTKDKSSMKPGIHTLSMNTNDLQSGMYIGKLISTSGENYSFRLVWNK